jgi:hypothetical protein
MLRLKNKVTGELFKANYQLEQFNFVKDDCPISVVDSEGNLKSFRRGYLEVLSD